MQNLQDTKLAIIGLGYVGLPLAVEFGKHYDTVGFDINQRRIDELGNGLDHTLEVNGEELAEAHRLRFSSQLADLADRNVYIVTVPTPIDSAKRPDLTPLIRASETLAKVLKHGDIVVYESTVYPGCTEEVCVPLLEKGRAWCSTATSSRATAPNASTRATSSTASPRFSKSPPVLPRKPPMRWIACTARSSPPARTRPARSRWPRPPR